MTLLAEMTTRQAKLTEKRNKLIDRQEELKVHYYRTGATVLTDDDKKFDNLQKQIDKVNAELSAEEIVMIPEEHLL